MLEGMELIRAHIAHAPIYNVSGRIHALVGPLIPEDRKKSFRTTMVNGKDQDTSLEQHQRAQKYTMRQNTHLSWSAHT